MKLRARREAALPQRRTEVAMPGEQRSGRNGQCVEQGDRALPTRLAAQVVYVREDVWEQFLQRARSDGDEALLSRLADWRNPSKVRPRSLQRNHSRP